MYVTLSNDTNDAEKAAGDVIILFLNKLMSDFLIKPHLWSSEKIWRKMEEKLSRNYVWLSRLRTSFFDVRNENHVGSGWKVEGFVT